MNERVENLVRELAVYTTRHLVSNDSKSLDEIVRLCRLIVDETNVEEL